MNDTILLSYITDAREEIVRLLDCACIITANEMPDGEYFTVKIIDNEGNVIYHADRDKLTELYKIIKGIVIGISLAQGKEV